MRNAYHRPMLKLWIVLAALLFNPPTPPPVVQSPATVECATCQGHGEYLEACSVCLGEGTHPCPTCRNFTTKVTVSWMTPWVPKAQAKVLVDGLRGLRDKLGEDAKVKKVPGTPKPLKLKAGELRCPAGCFSGELLHISNWVDCKLCKTGKMRCKHCKKSQLACHHCKGALSAMRPCDDCAGAGRLPDPSQLAFDECPWCLGSEKRECNTCDAQGQRVGPCHDCFGRGAKMPCNDCKAVGTQHCKKCGGRGRFGPNKVKCPDCDKKGTFKCPSCKRGRRACPTCPGDGISSTRCPHCLSLKSRTCDGCYQGSWGAWLYSAERARLNGDLARARGWLLGARERCDSRYGTYLDELDARARARGRSSEVLRKAVELERGDALIKIDRLLKAAVTAK